MHSQHHLFNLFIMVPISNILVMFSAGGFGLVSQVVECHFRLVYFDIPFMITDYEFRHHMTRYVSFIEIREGHCSRAPELYLPLVVK